MSTTHPWFETGDAQSKRGLVQLDVVDGGSENVCGGMSSPKTPTAMKKRPINAPHGQGPLGPNSSSLFGIQPVSPTTRRGKAETRAIVAPDRLNHESRNRIAVICPMPLIVNGTRGKRKVTSVQARPLTTRCGRDRDLHGNSVPDADLPGPLSNWSRSTPLI